LLGRSRKFRAVGTHLPGGGDYHAGKQLAREVAHGKAVAGQAFSDTPPDGRFIVVVYEEIDDDTVLPVTAYEVPEP
jgi:hypothetical protein